MVISKVYNYFLEVRYNLEEAGYSGLKNTANKG